MKATTNTYYDGHWYNVEDDIPDLGSFVATSVNGRVRGYEDLSTDINKLPKHNDLGTGSSAGWCGGECGKNANGPCAGGGGSSYIGFQSTTHNGTTYENVTVAGKRSGNGLAKITFITI